MRMLSYHKYTEDKAQMLSETDRRLFLFFRGIMVIFSSVSDLKAMG